MTLIEKDNNPIKIFLEQWKKYNDIPTQYRQRRASCYDGTFDALNQIFGQVQGPESFDSLPTHDTSKQTWIAKYLDRQNQLHFILRSIEGLVYTVPIPKSPIFDHYVRIQSSEGCQLFVKISKLREIFLEAAKKHNGNIKELLQKIQGIVQSYLPTPLAKEVQEYCGRDNMILINETLMSP